MNRKNLFLLVLFSCLSVSNIVNAGLFSSPCKSCSKDAYTCPNFNHNIKNFGDIRIVRSVAFTCEEQKSRLLVILEVRDGKVVEAYDTNYRPLTREFLRTQLEIKDRFVNDAYNFRFYFMGKNLLLGSNVSSGYSPQIFSKAQRTG